MGRSTRSVHQHGDGVRLGWRAGCESYRIRGRSGWELDLGAIASFPGATDAQSGTYVLVGETQKSVRFGWTQTIDWGSGIPSARICVGYFVMGEFDPVKVVLCYPAGTDRLTDVEALMSTFVVLGNPVASLPPGVTPAPTPTPFDKWASTAPMSPMPAGHGAPDLEALLPDSIDGRTLTKESNAGEQMGLTDADPILTAFGKHPSDLANAAAASNPTGNQAMLLVGVERLRGVPADQLLAARLKVIPDAKVSPSTLGGHPVTYVMYGAWPIWHYTTGELLYGIVGADDDVARVLAGLP